MASTQTFENLAERIKSMKKEPTNDEKLELYGLYKQATVGDVNIGCPGLFDVPGKSKWNAWNSRKGMSRDEAKKQYSQVATSILQKYAA